MTSHFDNIANFLSKKMRMSHIYQPAMIVALLKNQGVATVSRVAKEFLRRDTAHREYYEQITKRYPQQTLTKHGLIERIGNSYSLLGFDTLTELEVKELIEIAEEKIQRFEIERNGNFFSHRIASPHVSGSKRLQVLKRANTRCELCGVCIKDRAIEVYHILPRTRGGSNDIVNLQALCYLCNSNKGNRDDTDFRLAAESYNYRKSDCTYCDIAQEKILFENELAVVTLDKRSSTVISYLIFARRHIKDYFDLQQPEHNAITQLLQILRNQAIEHEPDSTDFSIEHNARGKSDKSSAHGCIRLTFSTN